MDFVPPLAMWRYIGIFPSALSGFFLWWDCVSVWCDGGRQVVPEPPRQSDSVQMEVSGSQGPDEGSKVGPAHREVAGEDLPEALIELSLNESSKGCRYILLDRCL